MTPAAVARFGRFLLVGTGATAVHYLVLVAGVEALGVGVVAASGAGFVAGATVNYLLNRRYTFRSSDTHLAAVPRFVVVATCGLLLNVVLMHVLVTRAVLPYLAAQVVATGTVLLWNFAGNALWTFRRVPPAGT